MDIISNKTDGIFVVTFNRHEKKNAITASMYDQLTELLQIADEDDDVAVIVIQGGASIFSAGADILDFLDNPPLSFDSPPYRFLTELSEARKPVIASVAGAAVGVGMTLLLHCDLVYAADTASFSVPFVHLGLCPEAACSLLLPQRVGYHRAAEMLLLGEVWSAKDANEIGLVNRVVPAEQLDAFVIAQAAKLARLSGPSVRLSKQLMKEGHAEMVASQMVREADYFSSLLKSSEAKQAFEAFLGKQRSRSVA